MTNTLAERAETATPVVAATLAVAVACWVVTVRRMTGMDMGPSTELGSFWFFLGVWVPMMAAMMLPSAVPAVGSFARTGRARLESALFVISYVAVWAAAGVAVYLLYRGHGTVVAGALIVSAGLYELTPLKRACRQGCRRLTSSGLEYGGYCLGCSAGLMLVLLALGVMSITWMALVSGIVFGQKVLPVNVRLDRALALGLVAAGVWVALAPGSVPGLVAPV
jgi:predicted metal-binding membrane protein